MYWNLGVHCPLTGLWCSCLTRVRKHCHTDIKLWHRGGSSAANAGTKGTGWCWWRSCKTPWSIIPTSLENNSPSCPHLGVGLRCFSTLILNHWNTALAELKRRYKWASLHLWKRAKGSGIHSGLASKIHVCTLHITLSFSAMAKRRNWRWKQAAPAAAPCVWGGHTTRGGGRAALKHQHFSILVGFSFLVPDFSYFFLFSSTKFCSILSQWFHNQNSHHLEEFLLFSSVQLLTFLLLFLRSFFPLLLFCLESPHFPVSNTSCWINSPLPASPFLHCPFPSSNEDFLSPFCKHFKAFSNEPHFSSVSSHPACWIRFLLFLRIC